jgi:DNA repair photolyase
MSRQPSSITGAARGRGARSNATSRFVDAKSEAFDDGWPPDEAAPKLATSILPMRSKTVIARNASPDVGFSRSINPYRGCEHGCIYCYARPAHAYLGLSPGLDFETRLFFKPEAGALLARELSAPRYKPQVIHIGGDTDPYQPVEKRLQVTRAVLQTLQRFSHPCSIITKSALIQRDLDILGPMAADRLIRAAVSVTSLDRRLARSMEPRAATPERRLGAIRALAQAGVPVVVMFAPVVPGLNDHELESVLEAAAEAGARGAGYVALRLPLEIADLFQEWLATDQPGRAAKVMSLMRQMRGGKIYESEWRTRMKGTGPIADLLAQRFKAAQRRYGLDRPQAGLDLTRFRVPPQAGDQIDLFA